MKAFRRIALTLSIIALFTFSIIGCEETPTSTTDDPVMSAKVDGSDWTAGENVQGTIFSSLKTITGAAGDGSSINLNLTNVFEPATLDFDGGKFTACYTIGSEDYDAKSGTVNVTALDGNNISGTFNFVGENATGDVLTVEDGTFTATLR